MTTPTIDVARDPNSRWLWHVFVDNVLVAWGSEDECRALAAELEELPEEARDLRDGFVDDPINPRLDVDPDEDDLLDRLTGRTRR